jgi:hypothetical protein
MFMKKFFKTDNERIRLLKLLSIGLIMRLFFAAVFEFYPYDLECFKLWALMAAKTNLVDFYTTINNEHLFVNYPPFYIYILGFDERE